MIPLFGWCENRRKSGQFLESFPNYFQNKVYYTVCVESVETCSGHFSPVFLRWTCYGKEKTGKEVSIMLGERIAALRRQAGLSQAELAHRLRISASAMGMYEQGRREPSAQMLVALAGVLGVSTDYLLTGVPASDQGESLDRMLLGRITSADRRLEKRTDRPFSRQELAVLFAAMLMEP